MTTEASSPSDAKRIAAIRDALATVFDPEVPVINVLDLGIVADVRVEDDRAVVCVTPTFAGCPALNMIRENIREAVEQIHERGARVEVVYDPPWTTDRISERGRRLLKEFGLAPPGARCAATATPDLSRIPCPFCDSTNTALESLFGPTLCRSIHYCHNCLQSFEHFKAV